MNKPKILFRTGVFTGAGAFAGCLAGMEITQYCLTFACLIAFMLADRYRQMTKFYS